MARAHRCPAHSKPVRGLHRRGPRKTGIGQTERSRRPEIVRCSLWLGTRAEGEVFLPSPVLLTRVKAQTSAITVTYEMPTTFPRDESFIAPASIPKPQR